MTSPALLLGLPYCRLVGLQWFPSPVMVFGAGPPNTALLRKRFQPYIVRPVFTDVIIFVRGTLQAAKCDWTHYVPFPLVWVVVGEVSKYITRFTAGGFTDLCIYICSNSLHCSVCWPYSRSVQFRSQRHSSALCWALCAWVCLLILYDPFWECKLGQSQLSKVPHQGPIYVCVRIVHRQSCL